MVYLFIIAIVDGKLLYFWHVNIAIIFIYFNITLKIKVEHVMC